MDRLLLLCRISCPHCRCELGLHLPQLRLRRGETGIRQLRPRHGELSLRLRHVPYRFLVCGVSLEPVGAVMWLGGEARR